MLGLGRANKGQIEAGALGWWERRCPGIPSRDKCSGGKFGPGPLLAVVEEIDTGPVWSAGGESRVLVFLPQLRGRDPTATV